MRLTGASIISIINFGHKDIRGKGEGWEQPMNRTERQKKVALVCLTLLLSSKAQNSAKISQTIRFR